MAIKYLSVGNEKMKKSSNTDSLVVSWGIPACDKTCPNAGACKKGCYAKSGRYLFANVKAALDRRLALAESEDFVPVINSEIAYLKGRNPDRQLYVRIHDTGDFFDEFYVAKWLQIMRDNPDVKFYAYTKMVTLFMGLESVGRIPDNFRIIYSYGGTEGDLIPSNKPHAKVFEWLDDLIKSGYVDCSTNDLLVYTTDRVGLVYHGNKKWENSGFIEIE